MPLQRNSSGMTYPAYPRAPMSTPPPRPRRATDPLAPVPLSQYQQFTPAFDESAHKKKLEDYANKGFNTFASGKDLTQFVQANDVSGASTPRVRTNLTLTKADGTTVGPGVVQHDPTDATDTDVSAIAQAAARKHYMTNVLPNEPGYQALQAEAVAARGNADKPIPAPLKPSDVLAQKRLEETQRLNDANIADKVEGRKIQAATTQQAADDRAAALTQRGHVAEQSSADRNRDMDIHAAATQVAGDQRQQGLDLKQKGIDLKQEAAQKKSSLDSSRQKMIDSRKDYDDMLNGKVHGSGKDGALTPEEHAAISERYKEDRDSHLENMKRQGAPATPQGTLTPAPQPGAPLNVAPATLNTPTGAAPTPPATPNSYPHTATGPNGEKVGWNGTAWEHIT